MDAAPLAPTDRAPARGARARSTARTRPATTACGRRAGAPSCSTRALRRCSAPPDAAAAASGSPRSGATAAAQQLPRSDIDLLIVHDGAIADGGRGARRAAPVPAVGRAGSRSGTRCARRSSATQVAARAARRPHVHARPPPARGRRGARGRGRRPRARRRDRRRGGVRARPARATRTSAAERFGSAAHLLEPDLKKGAGGLRDVAGGAAGSTARRRRALSAHRRARGARRRRRVPDPGPQRAAAGDRERAPTGCRSSCSRRSPGRWGSRDEPRLIAEDGLMRAVFEHARAVRWIAEQRRWLGPPRAHRCRRGRPSRSPARTRRSRRSATVGGGGRPADAAAPRLGSRRHSRRPDRVDRPDARGVPAHPARGRRRRRGPRRARPARPARAARARVGATCDAARSAIPTTGSPSTRICTTRSPR